MKRQIKFRSYLLGLAIIGLASCEQESVDELLVEEEANLTAEFYSFDIGGEPVTDAVILDLVDRLELNEETVSVNKKLMQYPDGTSEERIIIGGDASVTLKQLQEMVDNPGQRQYRTNNLVTGSNRTIDILGFTGGSQGLSGRAQNGLRDAVRNYNNLSGHNLRFRLTFGSSQSAIDNADMVLFDNSINQGGGGGGSAGFPSGGRPHKFIQIFNLQSFSRNVHEHVITHEIGHSVGFRHTDWFNRASCGQNTNEGQAGVGAVHIPGTPTGNNGSSLMNACFSASSNGEFNGNDRRALRRIY